ncbi:MAG: hypothetical protein SVV03_03650, partial [Candidatus Nanohaloarchaea archaeon]|nr:hypothetical protein [Candidatus Nanohaloarchaea archaeon]
MKDFLYTREEMEDYIEEWKNDGTLTGWIFGSLLATSVMGSLWSHAYQARQDARERILNNPTVKYRKESDRDRSEYKLRLQEEIRKILDNPELMEDAVEAWNEIERDQRLEESWRYPTEPNRHRD